MISIAVDDIATVPPSTSATRQSSPSPNIAASQAPGTTTKAAITARIVSTTCAAPSPKTSLRIEVSLARLNSRPEREHQEHDAEFARVSHRFRIARDIGRVRAEQHPDREVRDQRRELESAQAHHGEHRGSQQNQRDFESGEHSAGRLLSIYWFRWTHRF